MGTPLTVEDWRQAARRTLPRFVFDYVDGAAEDECSLRANRSAFDELEWVPRVLRDVSDIDATVTVFGRRWAAPMATAPTGLNGLVRPGGDIALARAARDAGVPFILSTASNDRLEAVREAAPDAELWLQLYVMQASGTTEQLLDRARAANCGALVLTVDVPVSGLRERDLRNGFRVPFRMSPRLLLDLLRHPGWALRQGLAGQPQFVNLVQNPGQPMSPAAQAALLKRVMDPSLDWQWLANLRRRWQGPLLLKGVLHHADARHAVEHGVDGLIVSNHGGRQLDGAIAPLRALPAVLDAVGGRLPVLLDSGVRRGGDIAKALALGASAVLLGRPLLYGLAAAGEDGAGAVLSQLADELHRVMVLLGAPDLPALRQASLQPVSAGRIPMTSALPGGSPAAAPALLHQ